jgi:hypothetical protein
MAEHYNLFVLTKRMDSDAQRRKEGLTILDNLSLWLTDRQEVDGEVFSAPTGVQVMGRSRIAGDTNAYQQTYVYALQLAVTHTLEQCDVRTWNDLETINHQMQTYEKDGSGDRITTVDQDIDMT